MRGEYVNALEVRKRWTGFAQSGGYRQGGRAYQSGLEVFPSYRDCLVHADTYFMNAAFCQMVDHAREAIPDDIEFELPWAKSERGWLYCETPFRVPAPQAHDRTEYDFILKSFGVDPEALTLNAIGWRATADGVFVMCFQDLAQLRPIKEGFGCWSYFLLRQGEKLLDRIRSFEAKAEEGDYKNERKSEMLHEMRWVYAAFHLMSQKMAHHSRVGLDRAARRRAQKENRPAPPDIRVISLRRLEESKAAHLAAGHREVDWQWQWHVKGHWRDQPYHDGNRKKIYIDSYMKGPADKPIKDPGQKLYVVK